MDASLPDSSASRRAALEMLVCTFFWGGFFVFGKLAVREAAPLAVATLRFVLAGAMLIVLLAWREPAALKLERKDWPLVLALGISGVTAYNALSFFGFADAPATDGAMISPSVNPVLTAIASAWLFREPLTRFKLGGLALALVGTALVFLGPLQSAHAGPTRLWGDALFAIAAVTWSVYTLLGKLASRRFSALASTTYASLIGALFLLPLGGHDLSSLHWRALSPTFWASELAMAALCTVASFLCMFDAIRLIGASRAASFNFLVPLFGVALAVLMLGERPAPLQAVGMLLTLGGVYLSNRRAPAGSAG